MKRIFPFLLLSLAYCLLANPTIAQSANVITVSPQLIQLDLSKDAPEAEFTYTNSTDQTIELTLSMQDVKELEDRGIPGLLDANESANYKYGLSSWASFSNKNLVISPNESKKVIVYIDKTRLSLGGHYASVLAEIQQKSPTKTVKLRAILSSLLFVRSGSEYDQEEAVISSMEQTSEYFQFPQSVTFRLQNTGNVDITPYGILTIYDPFKKEVARSVINEESSITLPDSVRKYTTKIKAQTSLLMPGMYTAELSIRFGKKNIQKEATLSFFSFGSLNGKILGVGALLILITGIIAVRLKKKQSSQ